MQDSTTAIDPKDAIIEKLIAMFPDRLVDPEVHPAIFASQVRMAKYAIFLETPPSTEIVIEGEPEIVIDAEDPPVKNKNKKDETNYDSF